ncbi:MAG: enoyl-CoA hydratase/isomerase family protein [Burkholderiaceae bacterium]|nr:enoyl-CoA hydratase/isomerase family protein [Burkholderiaceae bacterium]
MINVQQSTNGITQVTINNPDRRNALNLEMFQQLSILWPELDRDPAVRVVLLTAVGNQSFCVGADLSEALHKLPGIDKKIDQALLKTGFFSKPIVAAVNGDCIAGGLELLLAADIRIVNITAKIGFPEVRWGIVPSGGGAMKLGEQIGHAFAMDLLLTGRLISGAEAEKIGLITQAVASEDVMIIARQRAEMIAANSHIAIAATKRSALSWRAETYAHRETTELHLVKQVRESGHQDIGIAAFLAKCPPHYP